MSDIKETNLLPANLRKLARSLKEKKVRDETRLFPVEGEKMVQELLHSEYKVAWIAGTKHWLKEHRHACAGFHCYVVDETMLAGISSLKTPNQVIAVAHMPDYLPENIPSEMSLCLVLDGVQDPGNAGTIIRLADWFDIRYVFFSETCADSFNPKTVQASMGSIFRVNIVRTEIKEVCLQMQKKGWTIYGMDLKGTNLYEAPFNLPAMIVLGNESHGISETLRSTIQQLITIPRGGPGSKAESLNVGMAAAIVCAEFRRRFPG